MDKMVRYNTSNGMKYNRNEEDSGLKVILMSFKINFLAILIKTMQINGNKSKC